MIQANDDPLKALAVDVLEMDKEIGKLIVGRLQPIIEKHGMDLAYILVVHDTKQKLAFPAVGGGTSSGLAAEVLRFTADTIESQQPAFDIDLNPPPAQE